MAPFDGTRLEKCRTDLRLSRKELAELIGASDGNNIYRWERGIRKPSDEMMAKLAGVLNTSAAYLRFETDNPSPLLSATFRVEKDAPLDKAERVTEIPTKEWIKIPLLSRISAACAGSGNGLAYVEEDIDSWHWFPIELIGRIDPEHLPYIVHVEGDSMENAGILNGSQVIVNPAETVTDGDSALVCWNRDEVAVKLVYWQTDGGVLIRGTNPAYGERRFSKDDLDTGYLQIRGKIMWTGQRPKKMR